MTSSQALLAFRKEFTDLVRARCPLIHVVTWEEDRFLQEMREIAQHLGHRVLYWSTSRGVFDGTDSARRALPNNSDLAVALEVFAKTAETSQGHLFVLLDPFQYFNERGVNPIYRRQLREFATAIRTDGYRASCVIVGPQTSVPVDLEKEMTQIDFPLPGREEIRTIVHQLLDRVDGSKSLKVVEPETLAEALVDAALGLTAVEVQNALAKAVVDDLKLDFDDVENMFRQKQQIVRKSAILEYCDVRGLSMRAAGGLDALKDWLNVRDGAFSVEGRAFGIDVPKGVLLTGVPGCGKSLSAKCVAASWRLPLVKLDMGRVYSALVGSSEEHMRQAIAICESIAPCILWIDEIEKGLPRTGEFVGDSGVSLRVLGTFLTWLQEKTAPVFVFATANNLDLLPPEILRKGRFDEIFFVDLPTDQERREILNIHIARTGRDLAAYDLDELVELSGARRFGTNISLTGAELAAWVNEALIRAFSRKKDGEPAADLTMGDFREVNARTVPMARLRSEDIERLRLWAETHAVSASRQATAPPAARLLDGRALELTA